MLLGFVLREGRRILLLVYMIRVLVVMVSVGFWEIVVFKEGGNFFSVKRLGGYFLMIRKIFVVFKILR